MRTLVAIVVAAAVVEGSAGAAELPDEETLEGEAVRAPALAEDAPRAGADIDGAAGLAEADAEVESIAARLRRARSVRRGSALLPRIGIWLSLARGAPARVDREAGAADALGWGGRRGLAWAVVATWGAP